METKTIRFEKGAVYRGKLLRNIVTDEKATEFFLHIESVRGDIHFKCRTSFTVEIKIIEDEES